MRSVLAQGRLLLPLALLTCLSILGMLRTRIDDVDFQLQPDTVAGGSSANATTGRELRFALSNDEEVLQVKYRPDQAKAKGKREASLGIDVRKWTESLIWPCVNVEQRRPNFQNGSEPTLRVLHLHNWTIDAISDSKSQSYTKSMLDVLHTPRRSFSRSLERAIPDTSIAESSENPINPDKHNVAAFSGIRIQIDNVTSRLDPTIDESYRIYMPYPDGTDSENWIRVHAVTVYGARHGLETIKQLLQFGWLGKEHDDQDVPKTTTATSAVFTLPNVTYIQDGPAYLYRGLMIDTARHYLPLDIIIRNLFVMAANKLNVLHWHMTDSESWPYQSATFPELSQHGAYCKRCVYTRDEVESVVVQAALLGIRVIAEFDLPGHSKVIGRSHPELMRVDYSGKPSEPLDVTLPAVNKFVKALYHEIADVFPDDWMHIGGDEVSVYGLYRYARMKRWMAKHKIATDVELWQHFEVNAISIVETSLRKRAIVWHDSFEAGAILPKSTILDVWQLGNMHDSVFRAIDAGHDIVFSACWYLDAMDRDWWAFYSCDPRKLNYQHSIDTGRLTGEQKARILGGHSCMWGEVVDATNFFERVWPRASATAEVLWAGGAIEEEGTQDAVKSRLERFRCWMVQQFDIPASPISPGHCEMRPNVYTSGSSLF